MVLCAGCAYSWSMIGLIIKQKAMPLPMTTREARNRP